MKLNAFKNKLRNILGADAPAVYLKDKDHALTERAKELLFTLDVFELNDRVSVIWNHRLRSTAGRAQWPSCIIELNPELKNISEQEIDRTLRHELAHILANSRNLHRRIQPHGREWIAACRDLGIPNETATHRLPLKRTQQKKRYEYHCKNCENKVLRVRKIKGAAACHVCCKAFAGGRFSSEYLLIEKCL